jgi:hypothetical protein
MAVRFSHAKSAGGPASGGADVTFHLPTCKDCLQVRRATIWNFRIVEVEGARVCSILEHTDHSNAGTPSPLMLQAGVGAQTAQWRLADLGV